MRAANIDDVWPDYDVGGSLDEPSSYKVTPISSRVQTVEAGPKPNEEMARTIDVETVDGIIMERISTLLIVMLGCVTGLLVQIDRLRKEVRSLRVALHRPL